MSRGVSIEHVTFGYGATAVLDDVSLDVQKGEFFAFLGPSGSGKTTLLRVIAGLAKPRGGNVLVNGAIAHALQETQWFGQVGYVPQDPWLGHGTVRDARGLTSST